MAYPGRDIPYVPLDYRIEEIQYNDSNCFIENFRLLYADGSQSRLLGWEDV